MRVLQNCLFMLAVLFLPSIGPANADDIPIRLGEGSMLLMIDARDCVYCRKWEREVGPGYRASDEAKSAPLVKRERGHSDLGDIRGIAYTPTFILFDRGTEIGRIIGYAGADFFWGELDRLMKLASMRPGSSDTRATLPQAVLAGAVR